MKLIIDNKILRTRRHKGWDIERILTTPPMDYADTLKKGQCKNEVIN